MATTGPASGSPSHSSPWRLNDENSPGKVQHVRGASRASHQQCEIERARLHQHTFQSVLVPSQVHAAHASGLVEMCKRALQPFASQSEQSFRRRGSWIEDAAVQRGYIKPGDFAQFGCLAGWMLSTRLPQRSEDTRCRRHTWGPNRRRMRARSPACRKRVRTPGAVHINTSSSRPGPTPADSGGRIDRACAQQTAEPGADSAKRIQEVIAGPRMMRQSLWDHLRSRRISCSLRRRASANSRAAAAVLPLR